MKNALAYVYGKGGSSSEVHHYKQFFAENDTLTSLQTVRIYIPEPNQW